jgi:hypothetical protein
MYDICQHVEGANAFQVAGAMPTKNNQPPC